MRVTPIDPNTRFRMGHNTGEVYVLPHVQPGDILEGTQVFTAVDALMNSQGVVYQLPGDQWLSVHTVNGQARSGWVALSHLGEAICKDYVTPPPPEEIYLKHTIDVYSDGSLVIDGIAFP